MATEKDKKYTYAPGTYTPSGKVISASNEADYAANLYDTKLNQGVQWDDTALKQYTEEYEGRDPFSYDFNTDAIYQQYKDKYIQQGKMAMADTIGQASAMTGGYGNSYAATVGNQAYQAHLQQLNNVIPELYQLAYDKHNQEGQDLLTKIALLKDERSFAHSTYNADLERLLADRSYFKDIADRVSAEEYGRWLDSEEAKRTAWRDSVNDEQWAKTYGLSERELKMAEEAWAMEKKAYEQSLQPVVSASEKTKSNIKYGEPKKKEEKNKSVTYDDITSDLNTFIKNGANKSEINSYLRGALNAGYIDNAMYNKLKDLYAPRGYTY